MKRTTYLLLGVLIAMCGTVIAADIPVAGLPFFKDGALWARKAGTTNTKQDITSTSNALDVNIASGSTTPPTGTSATQVQGTAADGATAVGSPVQIGGVDSGGLVQALGASSGGILGTILRVTPADAVSNTSFEGRLLDPTTDNPGRLGVAPWQFNGTTWDRTRSAGIGNGVASTGIAAASPYGEYLTNANQYALTTGQYGAVNVDSAGNLRTAPQRPTATDILVGYATVTATTGSTTLATVAAGRTWVGQLCASVDGNKAATATGNGLVNATFLTTGTNVVPAAGTYFGVSASMGANAATGTVGTQGSNQGCTPWTQVSPAGNTTTINYATTCTNTTACAVHVSAIGVMQ